MGEQYMENVVADNLTKFYCASYDDLKKYHGAMLAEITNSAQGSPVYAGRVSQADSIERLKDLPMTGWDDIGRAYTKDGLDRALLSKPVKYWQTSGYSGDPKRMYFGARDLEAIYVNLMELLFISGALEEDLTLWNIGVGDPYLPGSMFDDCYEHYKDRVKVRATFISEPATNEEGFIKTLDKVSKARGINTMAAYPIIYYLIAMSANDPDWLGDKVADAFSKMLVLPVRILPRPISKALAGLYLRNIDYGAIKETMRTVKIGYVFGESLDPYEKYVRARYPSITFHNLLGSTELLVQAFQMTGGVRDISVVLKNFIPEIADMADVEAARKDPERRLKAVPWHEWKKGMKGELIITRPGECLPLIRYPTGDLIEVIDPARTLSIARGGVKYDITLPLIRILSRTMDVVDFEAPDESGAFFGYKFYSSNLDRSLQQAGNVRWWEFYKLHGSPGRFMLWVVPEHGVADVPAYKKELARCLLDQAEDHSVSFSLAMELNILDIVVARPDSFKEIDDIVQQRIKEGRPVGQIKPKHVHILKSEAEYDAIRKKKMSAT